MLSDSDSDISDIPPELPPRTPSRTMSNAVCTTSTNGETRSSRTTSVISTDNNLTAFVTDPWTNGTYCLIPCVVWSMDRLISYLFSVSCFFFCLLCSHTGEQHSNKKLEQSFTACMPFLMASSTFHHHHNHFTALFPGPVGWAGARRELLDFMVQGKINRGRHTDHPAGCHSIRTTQCPPPSSPHIFYRPDALPAAQPTASKHWRQM